MRRRIYKIDMSQLEIQNTKICTKRIAAIYRQLRMLLAPHPLAFGFVCGCTKVPSWPIATPVWEIIHAPVANSVFESAFFIGSFRVVGLARYVSAIALAFLKPA
jgi:hypothetical protein